MKRFLPWFLLGMLLLLPYAEATGSESSPKAEIINPTPGRMPSIGAMSSNGHYAWIDGELYDMTASPIAVIDNVSGSAITDDGRYIVRQGHESPALYDRIAGSWLELPCPDGYTSGSIQTVTPDGRHALGSVSGPGKSDYCVWDVTAGTTDIITGLPERDMQNEPNRARIRSISPDGRFLLGGVSTQFLLPIHNCSFVYDRTTHTYEIIGFDEKEGDPYPPGDWNYGDPVWDSWLEGLLFTSDASFTPDSKWIVGTAYIREDIPGSYFGNEFRCVYRYDLSKKKSMILYDQMSERDMECFAGGLDGILYAHTPALNPYAFGRVRHGNLYYPLEDILLQEYGLDLADHGIQNSGKTVSASADGRLLVQINSPESLYILRLSEPMADVIQNIDLLARHEVSPASGTAMTTIGEVVVKFQRDITVSPSAWRNTTLSDSKGNIVARALQSGGLSADGTELHIRFRTFTMEKGETYTVSIPEGAVRLAADESMSSAPIEFHYIGRGSDPVAITDITPADGSAIPSLDLNNYPLVAYFDADVKLAGTGAHYASLRATDEDEPFASLNILAASSGDLNRILAYPVGTVNLYAGSEYELIIPAGTVTDLSGNGLNEEIILHYTGTYVRPQAEGNVLFESDCNDYSGFLFYEGDHLTPLAEVASMGFSADYHPWMVVRESNESTDMAFGSHSMYVGGGRSDDWVTTEQIYIPDGSAYLEFDSQSWRKEASDRLKVYVYERRNNINLLSESIIEDIRANGVLIYDELQSPGENEETLTGEWTHNILPLADFEGKYVYICFLNDNENQSMVIIDNIAVRREMTVGIDIISPSSVVALEEGAVRGNVVVYSPLDVYSSISLTLRDAEGNSVSEISENGLALSAGSVFSFSFQTPLPLTVGEENRYTVDVILAGTDSEGQPAETTVSYAGYIRSLAFRPERRVVLEEYTGRDCPNCPRGIQMVSELHRQYPDNFIPIAIHTYSGDPKGRNVQEYSSFLQCDQVGAPSGRVNRRMISSPMYYDSQKGCYIARQHELSYDETLYLWADEVESELAEPVFLALESEVTDYDSGQVNVTSRIRSALNLRNQNIRVFAVLLEDGLSDYQCNGMGSFDDPLLGPWGKGGAYADSYVFDYTFNHVARTTWGQYFNGTPMLVPADITAGEEYSVDFSIQVPSNVENIENCHVAVMLIDANTERVVNASDSPMQRSGINAPVDPATDAPVEYYDLQGRRIINPTHGIYIRRQGSSVTKVIL